MNAEDAVLAKEMKGKRKRQRNKRQSQQEEGDAKY